MTDLPNSTIHFFSALERYGPICSIDSPDLINSEWVQFDHTATGKICPECQVLIGRAMTDRLPDRDEFIDAFRKVAGKHYPHPVFGCECIYDLPVNKDGQTVPLQVPWAFHISALAYEALMKEHND